MTWLMQWFPVLSIASIAIGLLHPATALAQTPSESPVTGTCLVGQPDGSFQGDRSVSRYELAAGLNACLNLLDTQFNIENYATKAEVNAIVQRQIELNQELGVLDDRVDVLEGEPSSE